MKTNMHAKALHFSSTLILFFLSLNTIINPSNSTLETFIYAGCSQIKYNPSTPYSSNLDSLLASLVNAASLSNFNKFKISLTQNDAVYGLYQCRGDLTSPDCHECVASAVARLGAICGGASGGVLQFEGCLVRYDNVSFLGVDDKGVVLDKCGPSVGYDFELFNRRDAVLAYLTNGTGQYFRVGGSGKVQGVVQCVQDLSVGECQDCLLEAIGRLRSECGGSAWGDMFLGKCYARYSDRGYTSARGNDDDMEKTLAIIIGLVAGVAVLIVFLSFLSKLCDKKGGK
ncbi:hypothetical protein ACJIZ3_019536 [Penstemon smallii]|uniref:Gnk2-homologous domain-containing protein n=1 Tax=Penstemon smallii TaxID=265156 RepID=A0ABD3T1F9_9LAMI